MSRRIMWLALAVAGLVSASVSSPVLAEDGYGHLTGQFVLEGDIPKLAPLKVAGKDANVCAAKPLSDNTLIVDEETKGIANIVVYLKKVDADAIHPKLKESKEKSVVFDQKNCRFTPHVLLVRTDQSVLVKSGDPINHNTHTHPFKNQELNFLVRPNDREGVPVEYTQAEFLPTPVNCDLHPHMKAYWLILDHPYMALTDKEGKFKIENLPEGNYKFTVWHEKVGYIDREFEVEIPSNDTEDAGKISVPVAKFKLD